MVVFTECPRHCNMCMSSDFCEDCDDDLVPVAGGCVKSCKLGYYQSPYDTQCLGKVIVTMGNSFCCCHGSLFPTLYKLLRTQPMPQLLGQLHSL